MATIKSEKHFNFPSGLIRVTLDSNNQVNIVDANHCLMSADFGDAESGERFFHLAAAGLFYALLHRKSDVPERLISELQVLYKKGVFPHIDDQFDALEELFAFGFEGGIPFEELVVRAKFEIKTTALPNRPVVYPGQIKLKLENGKQFTLYSGAGSIDFNSLRRPKLMGPESVDEEAGTRRFDLGYDFPLFYDTLRHNDYFPADWTELKGAEVLETDVVVYDFKFHLSVPPMLLAPEDVISIAINIDSCTMVNRRLNYEAYVAYDSAEQRAHQNM